MENRRTKAYLALLVVCIVWGTTYLALRIGVMTFPPFLFSAVRQIVAGGLLLGGILFTQKKISISRKDMLRQIVPGMLMIALGNGVIAWTEKFIPSGLAALIVSVMPIYVIIINYAVGEKKQAMNKEIVFGLLLGVAGVMLIFRDNLADLANHDYLMGVIVAFLSCFCWAAGTVYTKQRPSEANSFANAAVQFISGGIVLLIISWAFDDWSQMKHVSTNSLLALGYLISVGSIVAYVCYLYALKNLPSGLASVYAYINPFIAIILGFLVLDEKITWITWLAFITTLTGVYWINKGYTRPTPVKKEKLKKVVAKGLFLMVVLAFTQDAWAQKQWWTGRLHRSDGESIAFTFAWKRIKNNDIWHIRNGTENIEVTNIRKAGDSLIVQMPVFESVFHVKQRKNFLSGYWIKGGAQHSQVLYFTATPGTDRPETMAADVKNVSGRWSVRYAGDSVAETVAEFKQSGTSVAGTFLSPTGDDRYLTGVVHHDSLLLSTFDGAHAFLIKAAIGNHTLKGVRYSGATGKINWTAVLDSLAAVPEWSAAMHLRPGEDSLHFAFKDTKGNLVSISGARFRNKVVVVQLMGSWCPNCMDETAFLSEYYNLNKQRGIEVVALAYEYTTDRQRSLNSVRKFQERFHLKYPILITGVAVTDSLRTEKTLPELTPIQFFPSSVILDKKGVVRKLDTGFNGPATGEHYTLYKKDFEDTIDKLLMEK